MGNIFAIDYDCSHNYPESRMAASFGVSRDESWSSWDEKVVLEDGCVIYIVGPPMDRDNAVDTSVKALQLIGHAFKFGATAAKGESAGIAHGFTRWRQLVEEVQKPLHQKDLLSLCRLALCKRPLSDGEMFVSAGFHLVGSPDVCIKKSASMDARTSAVLMDKLSDEIVFDGEAAVRSRHGCVILPDDSNEEGEFMYNPYGFINVDFCRPI